MLGFHIFIRNFGKQVSKTGFHKFFAFVAAKLVGISVRKHINHVGITHVKFLHRKWREMFVNCHRHSVSFNGFCFFIFDDKQRVIRARKVKFAFREVNYGHGNVHAVFGIVFALFVLFQSLNDIFTKLIQNFARVGNAAFVYNFV